MQPAQRAIVAVLVVFAALVVVVGAPSYRAGAATYTLRPGDTLGDVANRLRVPLGQLAAANGIRDPARVLAGRVLVLPGPITATAARPEPSGAVAGSYTVRFGDTLSAIATRLGVPRTELAATNGITNPNLLMAGRVLIVRRGWLCPVSTRPQFVNDFGYVRPDRPGPHQGIDVFAPRGTPVVAPISGVLTRFPNPMGGLAVQLQGTDGVRYYGAHLDRYGAVGRVAAGTVIGYVGNTGNARATSPHLHFEAHPGGGPATNPYATLVKACR